MAALHQSILAGDPSEGAPAPPLRRVRPTTNLPAPVTELIGRDHAVQRVRELLATGRLVTLTGPGGVGKTSVALTVARAVVEAYPGGVWLIDLTTSDGIGTTIPLVVANMTAIAGRRMAETVARRGGITVIPQDIPLDVVTEVVSWVKQRHAVYETALTLTRHDTAGDALALIPKRAYGAVVIVDGDRPVGIVTTSDCTGVDRFTQLSEVMSTDLLTIEEGTPIAEKPAGDRTFRRPDASRHA